LLHENLQQASYTRKTWNLHKETCIGTEPPEQKGVNLEDRVGRNLSAIDVTAKANFERLYLVPGLRQFAFFVQGFDFPFKRSYGKGRGRECMRVLDRVMGMGREPGIFL